MRTSNLHVAPAATGEGPPRRTGAWALPLRLVPDLEPRDGAGPWLATHGRPLLLGGLAVSGWVALAAQWVALPTPVRTVLIFGFVLVAPGTAAVLRLPLVDRVEKAMLAIGTSVAIAIPVSEAFAFAHAWSAEAVLATLAALTTVLVALPRRRRRVPKPEWRPLHGPHPIAITPREDPT